MALLAACFKAYPLLALYTSSFLAAHHSLCLHQHKMSIPPQGSVHLCLTSCVLLCKECPTKAGPMALPAGCLGPGLPLLWPSLLPAGSGFPDMPCILERCALARAKDVSVAGSSLRAEEKRVR
eukprot:1143253-Pelagomonas_calceolata.AAC.2